ncbi:MAG: hypothetical protein RI887_987, partial [Actinomycetota bacterium]
MDPSHIASVVPNALVVGNLKDTLDYAVTQDSMVVVFGSLYLIADLYR